MEPSIKVEYERTEDLVPYARNAKKHTKKQVAEIANSIREFGFNDPVGVWTNADGESEIVEGQGRVMAAQKLHMEVVPVIHLDSLTDEQRRAYALAHNQTNMETGWDWDLLGDEFADLGDAFDLEGLGFSAADIATAKDAGAYMEEVSEEELEAYREHAEAGLKAVSVYLICRNREEMEFVAGLVGAEPEKLRRSYYVSDILRRRAAE